jgi:hypothetical protein
LRIWQWIIWEGKVGKRFSLLLGDVAGFQLNWLDGRRCLLHSYSCWCRWLRLLSLRWRRHGYCLPLLELDVRFINELGP